MSSTPEGAIRGGFRVLSKIIRAWKTCPQHPAHEVTCCGFGFVSGSCVPSDMMVRSLSLVWALTLLLTATSLSYTSSYLDSPPFNFSLLIPFSLTLCCPIHSLFCPHFLSSLRSCFSPLLHFLPSVSSLDSCLSRSNSSLQFPCNVNRLVISIFSRLPLPFRVMHFNPARQCSCIFRSLHFAF